MTYQEKLKNPKWQKKRLLVLERDEWLCQLCGHSDVTLHVHHKSYHNNPWDSPLDDLICYCEHCHSLVEYNKRNKIDSDPIVTLKTTSDDSNTVRTFAVCRDKPDESDTMIHVYDYKNNITDLVFSINKNIVCLLAKGINIIDRKTPIDG